MVSTNSSVGNIAQLGRGASTEMLNSSAPFANCNQLPSSNDLLSSNAPNQLQISSSSVMGPPSAIVIAGQQGAVQSSTGEGAGPMYSQVYSQPTTQPPSQQQTQVSAVITKNVIIFSMYHCSVKAWNKTPAGCINLLARNIYKGTQFARNAKFLWTRGAFL